MSEIIKAECYDRRLLRAGFTKNDYDSPSSDNEKRSPYKSPSPPKKRILGYYSSGMEIKRNDRVQYRGAEWLVMNVHRDNIRIHKHGTRLCMVETKIIQVKFVDGED
jgi:hypothetical protein